MSKPIIEVEHLSKCYRIGAAREPYLSLRDEVTKKARRFLSAVSRAFGNGEGGSSGGETDFWALDDVSFSVQEGETVGIIGRNGAGKSTLLKILSQITPPTKGKITMRGRVASLLEVGTGFHPELTGRENIFLNGAILGMRREEIKRKFDEIVAFAEEGKFLDTPVKRYSSGMYVRLAFAVAAHLEPEILVVDEVLAVGDAEFQKKCLGKMGDVAKEGRTVLFVSHNIAAVQQLCKRSLLLEDGIVKFEGGTTETVRNYLNTCFSNRSFEFINNNVKCTNDWQIISANLHFNGQKTDQYFNGQNVEVKLLCEGYKEDTISIEVLIRDKDHIPVLFLPCGLKNNENFVVKPSKTVISIILCLPFLANGRYYIDLIVANSGIRIIDLHENCMSFEIKSAIIEKTGWNFSQDRNQSCILLEGRANIRNEY